MDGRPAAAGYGSYPQLPGKLPLRLDDADWLDSAFSVGDLMMVLVLQRLGPSGILAKFANIAGYVDRAEARPAYHRAFAAQRSFSQRTS